MTVSNMFSYDIFMFL